MRRFNILRALGNYHVIEPNVAALFRHGVGKILVFIHADESIAGVYHGHCGFAVYHAGAHVIRAEAFSERLLGDEQVARFGDFGLAAGIEVVAQVFERYAD